MWTRLYVYIQFTDSDWSKVFPSKKVNTLYYAQQISYYYSIYNINKANKLSITSSEEVLHTGEIHTRHSHRFYLY